MEIKHPELKMSEVKVRKAKIDSAGNLFYVLEDRKIPSLLIQNENEGSKDTPDSD